MVKAVRSCGLIVGQVIFNGDELRVVISGDIGDGPAPRIDEIANDDGLIREPQP